MKYIILFLISLMSKQAFAQNGTIDSLRTVLKTTIADTNKVNTLNSLSKQLWQTAEYDKARDYALDALNLSTILSFKKGKADSYHNLGVINNFQGNYSEALKNHFFALEIRNELGNKKDMLSSTNNIGTVYRNLGNYNKALFYYSSCKTLCEEINYKSGIAKTSNNIGLTYKELGNYPEALNNYFASLKNAEDELGKAETMGNIANIYWIQGNHAEALIKQKESLAIFKKSGNKRNQAIGYNNLGLSYASQNDFQEAINHYDSALKLYDIIGDKRGYSTTYDNKGLVYMNQGMYQNAINYFLQAVRIKRGIGDKEGLAACLIDLGTTSAKLNKLADAKKHLAEALALSKEIGSKDDIKESYYALAYLDSCTGNFQKAYEDYKSYIIYRDSLSNEENIKKSMRLQMNYENKKRDNEILLLSKDKKIKDDKIKQQYKNVVLAACAAGLLFLTMIIILLWYQRRRTMYDLKIREMDNKFLRFQLKPHFVSNAVAAIRKYIRVHPELADAYFEKYTVLMRDILINSEKETVSLEEEISMLKKYMDLESLRIKNGFDYEVNIDSAIDDEAVMVPPLILQPIVENAIWHGIAGYSEKGKITIQISLENKILRCVVENYCGGTQTIEVEHEKKGKSFGLKISRERLKLLSKEKSGKWFLETYPGAYGMKVQLGIPV